MFVKSLSVASGFAAITLSAAFMTGAAHAENFQSNGRTSAVYHGDLDLSKLSDQALLHRRISRATNRVCVTRDLMAQQQCKVRALAHVDARVRNAIARAGAGERYADAAGADVRSPSGN